MIICYILSKLSKKYWNDIFLSLAHFYEFQIAMSFTSSAISEATPLPYLSPIGKNLTLPSSLSHPPQLRYQFICHPIKRLISKVHAYNITHSDNQQYKTFNAIHIHISTIEIYIIQFIYMKLPMLAKQCVMKGPFKNFILS